MKALPDSRTSFSHTQSLWRFPHNDAVTPQVLCTPLLAGAREGVASGCDRYVLIPMTGRG